MNGFLFYLLVGKEKMKGYVYKKWTMITKKKGTNILLTDVTALVYDTQKKYI